MPRLAIFLVLTVLFSAPCWYLSREIGYLYTTLLMWSPAAAALITNRFYPVPGLDLGLSRFNWRATLAAYLVISFTITAVFLALYAVHLADFPDPAEWQKAIDKAGLAGWPFPASALIFYLLTITAGIVSLSAAALGEEIGWRGFLAPELYRKYGFTTAALGSGILWSLWHYPLFVGKNSPLELTNFTVTLTGLSVFMCWFRLRSNSVWPAAITHGVYNALLGSYFMRFTLPVRPEDAIWLDDSGYAMAFAGMVLAAIFWSLRKRAELAWVKDYEIPASVGSSRRPL